MTLIIINEVIMFWYIKMKENLFLMNLKNNNSNLFALSSLSDHFIIDE